MRRKKSKRPKPGVPELNDINRWFFAETAHDPRSWCSQGELLWHAGETVIKGHLWWPRGEASELGAYVRGPELMLRGMAIECFLKCILIAQNRLWTKWDARLGNYVGPPIHVLKSLAKEAKLTLDEDERRICRLLTGFILWRGRYPSPKEYSAAPLSEWGAEEDRVLAGFHARCLAAANAEADRIGAEWMFDDGCPEP